MVCRLWVIVTSSTPLKVYLFDGGVVIFGSVNKERTDVDMPADDEVCPWYCLHSSRIKPTLLSSHAAGCQ